VRDSRQRRSALIRSVVLLHLEQGPDTVKGTWSMVRSSLLFPLSEDAVRSALVALRTEGKARYHEGRWELADRG